MTLLLDIEGTVCPVAFVHDVMFPYARARLRAWVEASRGDPLLADVAAEGGADVGDRDALVAVLSAWMDADRKITPLKAVQGRIWREGFTSGALVTPLYDDVAPAMRAWGRVAIYSSGSIEAQKLLFAHTSQGDLTPRISAWFDTTTGPKRSASSYEAIARVLPGPITFCSDIVEELDAAVQAGLTPWWVVRDGPATGRYPAHGALPGLVGSDTDNTSR